MSGFLTDFTFDPESLYNSVNSSGNMLWAPLKDGLQHFVYEEVPTKDNAQETWMLIHEFGHCLQEGVHSLFVKGGLSTETDEQLHELARCLHLVTPEKVSNEMRVQIEAAQK